jgi:triphosphoribosyl-dephospho-CoA synthase
VARRHGKERAQALRADAAAFLRAYDAMPEPARLDALRTLDTTLKAQGINPGTSADMTVATLLATDLRFNLRQRPLGG